MENEQLKKRILENLKNNPCEVNINVEDIDRHIKHRNTLSDEKKKTYDWFWFGIYNKYDFVTISSMKKAKQNLDYFF